MHMFTSMDYMHSTFAKDSKCPLPRAVSCTILGETFWDTANKILHLSEQLKVLKLVDGDKKPTMCCAYDAMNSAKLAMQKRSKERGVNDY